MGNDSLDPVAGRVPPNDLDAEGSVLSAILFDTDAREICMDMLSMDRFYADANKRIFEAAKYLHTNGQPVDMITVSGRLRDTGRLDQIGGLPYIAELAQQIPALSNVERHAELIIEKARQRSIVALCQTFAAEGYGAIGNVEDWLQGVERAFFEAISQDKKGDGADDLSLLVPLAVNVLEQRARDGGGVPGVDIGLSDVTRQLNGMARGEVTVLGARPKIGKTSFALNIARNVAGLNATEGPKQIVIYGSAEMPKDQLTNRLLASEARIDMTRVMSGRMQREDWTRMVAAAATLKNLPLAISFRPGMRLGQLRADIRRTVRDQKNKHGSDAELGLVVADYLQIMDGERRDGDSKENEISNLSRGLKWIAGEFNCPVLALAQLNREVEKRPDKRPQLSDFRDSGSIEQDAYAVMFLYRDEVYNPESEHRGIAEVIIAANRNGPPGKVLVKFTPEYTRFDTLAQGEFDDYGDAPPQEHWSDR